MKIIEEFFTNRISFTIQDVVRPYPINHNYRVKEYEYRSKIHNPQSLNITNSFDLAEKLMPLICYIVSDTKKLKNEVEDYLNYCFSLFIDIYSDYSVAGDGD